MDVMDIPGCSSTSKDGFSRDKSSSERSGEWRNNGRRKKTVRSTPKKTNPATIPGPALLMRLITSKFFDLNSFFWDI